MDKNIENQNKLEKEQFEEIKKLSTAFGAFIKELEVLKDKKEIFGGPSKKQDDKEDETDKKINEKINKVFEYLDKSQSSLYNSMHSLASQLHDRLDRLNSSHWDYKEKHSAGHIPALTASQMSKLLTASDLHNDFNVQKPSIYCSTTSTNKNVILVEIDYKKKN